LSWGNYLKLKKEQNRGYHHRQLSLIKKLKETPRLSSPASTKRHFFILFPAADYSWSIYNKKLRKRGGSLKIKKIKYLFV